MNLLRTLSLASIVALCGTAAQAVPQTTGVELGTAVQFDANSTNALNFAQQAPGHIGQVAPFVFFVSNEAGKVTLEFNNEANGLAFFEIRIDNITTGATPHPIALGDTIHTGGISVLASTSPRIETFEANEMVEVRLALGGERDWDFNWTAFYVGVPEPATMAIFGLGLVGMGLATRRRRSDA